MECTHFDIMPTRYGNKIVLKKNCIKDVALMQLKPKTKYINPNSIYANESKTQCNSWCGRLPNDNLLEESKKCEAKNEHAEI